jgi:site-specific DNA-methyltransferase (adenine-specific)
MEQVMDLREIPLADIKVPEDRARQDKGTITDERSESLESLIKNIEINGLIQPITVDKNLVLIAGERRLIAHRKLNRPTIMAIVRDDLYTKTISAYEIELFENTHRLKLHWKDRATLELTINRLKVEQFGKFEPTVNPKGWSFARQASLVGSDESTVRRRIEMAETLEEVPELLEECKTEDEAWKVNLKLKERGAQLEMLKKLPPEIKRAVDFAADHYKIGDAFVGMESLSDNNVTFAEVDPPYGVDLDRRKSRNLSNTEMDGYSEWEESDYPAMFEKTASLVYRKLEPNAFAVFWYGMTWHHEVITILRKVGFGVPDIPSIWNKGDVGQTASPDTTFGSCYEPFFLARKGQPKLHKPGRGNVFSYPMMQRKVHPTEKPLPLMMDIIDTIIFPGSRVLIPFLGSGVTLRACYKLKHTGFGWDLSQEHKDGFLKRVSEDKPNEKSTRDGGPQQPAANSGGSSE